MITIILHVSLIIRYNIFMYTIEQIENMLLLDGRGITIDTSSYKKMTENATFIHPLYGKWEATPKKVVIQKTTHPQEANLNRKLSNVKARQDGSILEKTKKTNMDKFGVTCASQASIVKEKMAKTCLDRYGGKSSLSNSKIREKGKHTKLIRYGDENFRNEDQIESTNLSKYGYKNAMSNPVICEKAIKTKEKNGLITRPRGKTWEELAQELGVPRTSLQSFVRTNPDEKAIENFLESRAEGYTDIEKTLSTLLNIKKHVGQIAGYRPDFKVGNVYINTDGLYWHSQRIKDRKKKYHFKLRVDFEEANERILQFRADEIKYKSDIVHSIINNICGNTPNKVWARKCILAVVESHEARKFLNKNHLMGSSSSKFIGLYHDNTLVSVMGYKLKKRSLEIDRFANLTHHSVVGGLSKMLSFLKKEYAEKADNINYWVDLRYGTGNSLTSIGFIFKRDVQSWQWTDMNKTYHRSKCKASATQTQQEIAKTMGLWQIFDAGQRLYTLTL